MKTIFVIFIFGFLSCSQNKKELKVEKSPSNGTNFDIKSESTDNSEIGVLNSVFRNQGESYVLVTGENDSIVTEINNVSYSEKYLNFQKNLSYYILKTTQSTKSIRGHEGQYSSIKVEIFNIPDSKLISTIETLSDDISFFTNFYKTVKYGCCGSENYYELASLWKNETFLRFNSKYYYIEIPNARVSFYIGFLSAARDEKNLILGELYLAHSILKSVPGESTFLQEFKTINKLIFKTKDKDLYGKIVPFCPDITLIKNTDKDELFNYPDRQELRLWSYNFCKDPKGIDFKALKLEFSNGKIYSVEVPIENGYLFGEIDNFEKTVYVEE
jgi:hypothetical protein